MRLRSQHHYARWAHQQAGIQAVAAICHSNCEVAQWQVLQSPGSRVGHQTLPSFCSITWALVFTRSVGTRPLHVHVPGKWAAPL